MNKLIDCVLAHKNDKHYFFNGNYYSRYTPNVGVDEGYPKLISSNWPSGNPPSGYKKLATVMQDEGWDFFDTVLPKSDFKAYYFFKGNRYVKYESGKGVPNSYPRSINSDYWYNIWNIMPGPYDAAFYSENKNKYYFFKGSKYLSIIPSQGIDNNYPRPIVEHWNGLGTYFPGPYSAVSPSQTNNEITFFFKGDEYVRYKEGQGVDNSVGNGEWAYPQSIAYRWSGVWSLKKISALTLGTFKTYSIGNTQKVGPTFSLRQLEDEPITMKPIPDVSLVEIKKIRNDNYKGVTKWFQLQGMAPNHKKKIVLKSNNKVVETFSMKNSPALGTDSNFTFAMSSCLYDSRQIQSTIPSVNSMQREAPDFMIWNGDTSYYVGPKGTYSGEADVINGDMKRQHLMFLRMYKTRHHPSVAAGMRAIPAISTWDDHDFGFNNSGKHNMTSNQVDKATEVFRTCWPNDYIRQNIENSIEHSFQYGNTAFFFPDGRSYRNKNTKVILGKAQCISLLKDMSNGPMKDAKLKVVVLASQLISTKDSTEGFFGGAPKERIKLLTAFSNGSISGRILVLSGDVHFSELSHYGGTVGNPKVIEVTSSPLLLRKPQGEEKFSEPDFNVFRVWSAKGNMYALINISYNDAPIVDVQLRDSTGSTANIYRKGGGTGFIWNNASAIWNQNGDLSQG